MLTVKLDTGFLAFALMVVFAFCGVADAYECHESFPFPSCPRPSGDRPEDTVCCILNGDYQCCSEDTLTAWAITAIVVAVLVVVGVLIAFVLCCCGICNACITCCKPKRKEYVVIGEPSAAYTTTTYNYGPPPVSSYGTGPPPPPGYQPPAPTNEKPVKPV